MQSYRTKPSAFTPPSTGYLISRGTANSILLGIGLAVLITAVWQWYQPPVAPPALLDFVEVCGSIG